MQTKWIEPLMTWRLWVPPAVMSVFLIGVAQYSFLAFHTLVELFAIVISFVMFAFAWSTQTFVRNNFLLFLACGYFWIGSLDLMHTLVYTGMNVFVEGSGNLAVQFWVGTRYSESILLLAAPFAASRIQNRYLLFVVFGSIAAVITILIFLGQFPVGFVEGKGLTDFKIYSEYLIDLILALALVALFRFGSQISREEKVLIAVAIIMTMFAELAFTFYVSVFGLSNLAGHIFKLFSFWFIFHAIVIHNLKKPYAALQASEARFGAVVNNSPAKIHIKDMAGRYTLINKKLAKLWDADDAEYLGKTVYEVFEKEAADVFTAHDQMVIKSGRAVDDEEVMILEDGAHTFLTTKFPIFDHGRITGIGAIGTDITERKRSEEKFRTAFEHISVGIVEIDETGVVRSFNTAAQDIFGYSADDIIGQSVNILMPEPDFSAHDSYIQNYLKTDKPKIIGIGREVTGVRKNGEIFPLHLGVGEMMFGDSRSFIGSITDLSELKQLETQLRQAQKMEIVGQLTGGIAHDFNNLLGVMIGNTEILGDEIKNNDNAKRNIEALKKAIDRAASLTSRLLSFSRQQTLSPVFTEINSLVNGLEEMLQRTLGETIDLTIECGLDIWPATIDQHQFENALVNLVINARDAMPKGGVLSIQTANVTLDRQQYEEVLPGDYITVAVSDTGSGIPPDVLDKVFEPFFTTKGVGEGSGLGLSMVYGFAKQSNGHIAIHTEQDQGTEVMLYMPRSELAAGHKDNTKNTPQIAVETDAS